MAEKQKTLSQARPNRRNPRRITDKKRQMLRDALLKFGDLSGVVVNAALGHEVVGGHQRRDVFLAANDGDIHIDRRYDPPTASGTVAEGFVLLGAERFVYREVSWPSREMHQMAGLAANRGAGDWDMPMVADLLGDLSDCGLNLDLSLFSEAERTSLMPGPPEAPAEKADAQQAAAIACPSCGHEFYRSEA